MGVLNLAGLSIVGWVAAWRFDSDCSRGVPFSTGAKNNGLVGL